MDYVKYIRSLVGHKKIILPAVGAIIVRDGKILLQRRSDNRLWGLVGGIMEMGETFEQTVIREAAEETGLVIRPDFLVGIYHNFDMVWTNGDEAHIICAVYKASILSGEPRIDDESLELRFFAPAELPELFTANHQRAMEDYLAGRQNQIH